MKENHLLDDDVDIRVSWIYTFMQTRHAFSTVYYLSTICLHYACILVYLHMAVYSRYNFLFPLKCSKAIQSTVTSLFHLQNHTFNILQIAHHDGNPSYWCVYSSLYHRHNVIRKFRAYWKLFINKWLLTSMCKFTNCLQTPKK
jgi:hypothetical protein